MKKVILSAALIVTISLTSCKNQTKTTIETTNTEVSKEMVMTDISFGVRGNCGMCKNTIEKAANGIDGVENATWNVDEKKVDVSFDDTKTNEMEIHKVIGSEEAYINLPGCCKYDHEMVMNQTGELKTDDQ